MSTKGDIEKLKDAVLLDSADGRDLTRIGRNFGVPRPKFNSGSDSVFRKIIPLSSWAPKMTLATTLGLLEAFLGDPTTVGWRLYDIRPNVFVVEIPNSVFPVGTLEDTTYLHQDLSPPTDTTTTLVTNVGDTSVSVVSTAGSPTSGRIVVDNKMSQETLLYSSITATEYVLASGQKVRKPHAVGTQVKMLEIESFSTSYIGDYFVATPKTTSLAADVLAGATTASLPTGHGLPPQGFIWFQKGTSVQERIYGVVSANTFTIRDANVTSFAKNHGVGTEVKYYDYQLGATEASDPAVGGNPILLYSDTLVADIKSFLDLIKASGVEVQIRRV